jgi:hypothetical protein
VKTGPAADVVGVDDATVADGSDVAVTIGDEEVRPVAVGSGVGDEAAGVGVGAGSGSIRARYSRSPPPMAASKTPAMMRKAR